MSTWAGRFVGNALDPLHIVYKPDASPDANRDLALKASADAETTATGDAQEKLATIYGGELGKLSQATGLMGDASRLRQDQIAAAADNMAGWRPDVFDATAAAPQDVHLIGGNLQDAATAQRQQALGQQRQDLAAVMAGQQGAGPTVAGAQMNVALDAARRQAGVQAAAGRGGNTGLAARAGMLQSAAPQVAVQGAQARGQELATLRNQVSGGQSRVFGNVLSLDKNAQQQEQLRNQVALTNSGAAVRTAGLASDAFGQAVRDYKVGGALTKTADTAKLNAYDQKMQDTEGAFASYQDYLQRLYGTGLDAAVKGGQRAAGTLSTILAAGRAQDAANANLVGTVAGAVMGGAGGAAAKGAATPSDNGGGG